MNRLDTRRRLKVLAESDDQAERIEAAQALSLTGGRWVRKSLQDLLDTHESPEVRAQASWALGFHPQGAQAVDSLLRILGDRDADIDVRAHCAEALGHMAGGLGKRESDVLGALLHALMDAQPEIRFWAAFGLGNLGDERAIPALERLAARDTESVEGWWSVRKEALDSIEQILLIKRNREENDGVEGA